MNLKERCKKIKQDIPTVCFALKHPKTPWYAKGLLAVAVAYALSPIDLVPDFIPVLGYLDDVLLLPALILLAVRLIPHDVYQECKEQTRALQNGKMQKMWYYAIPVVAIWVAILGLILWKILK